MVLQQGAPYTFTYKSPPRPSNIYPVLWRFAAERQIIYMRRIAGCPPPWTSDEVLRAFRFTNVYRASDRVSQHLIRMIYSGSHPVEPATIFLRTLLFKIFNKVETWEAIVSESGLPSSDTFDFRAADRVLSGLYRHRIPIYSAAYIMPCAGTSGGFKHSSHLRLLRKMLEDRLPDKLAASRSLESAYRLVLAYPSIGPFLGFQYTIDLNYTPLLNHAEADFVVAGPGAIDGMSKVFDSLGDYSPADTIYWLTDRQEAEFYRYQLDFPFLWGRRLQPIDVQNVLCEVSKYTRATHPEIKGAAGRTRIKRLYTPTGNIPAPLFPPKWGITPGVNTWPACL